MKKNIVKIGLLSVLSLGSILSLNSCRDAIYIDQDGEVTEEAFFSSVGNLQKFLQGDVYLNMDNATGIFASSVLTDEVRVGSSNGGNNIGNFRHIIDSNNSLAKSIWLDNYALINKATRLIEGAKKVSPKNAEETKLYNKTIAEARALRALAYLQLETFFSENMADDNALGVMIVSAVPDVDTQLPRSKNAEVYAVIEEDLTFAEQYLDQSSRYRASKDLVNAIRARLNLYRGKHTEAKKYAELVINGSGLKLTDATSAKFDVTKVGTKEWNETFYADESTSPYRQMWSDKIQGEVVFALARPVVGPAFANAGYFYNTNTSTTGGNPKWEMGRNLFNILEATKGDVRRYAYLDPTSVIDPNYLTSKDRTSDQLIIDKYPGKGTSALRNDVKVFRIAEMHLILAEAAVAAGDLAGAATHIEKIRVARKYEGAVVKPTYTSEKEALADILKERRVELAFEGHRFIDLKRLAVKAGVSMDRNETDDAIGVPVENLENGSYKYTLPIPAAEIAGNKVIQQNKGY